jgi:death-on-curing protein
MNGPRWVSKPVLLGLHAETIERHGGSHGLRDEGLLESALMRPENAYAGNEDLFMLAALYAAGISGNHPFIDGNKRAAFAAGTFLLVNGFRLAVSKPEATEKVLALAAGSLDEAGFADWLRAVAVPYEPTPPGVRQP